MASEDVIELGSSDEETRPAKKIKAGPNAMVHIPNSLHGVTIKPAKSSASLGGAKGQKLVKTYNSIPPLNRKIAKTNGKKSQMVSQKTYTIGNSLPKSIPIVGNMARPLNVNPVSVIKKLNSSQIMVNKLPSHINVLKAPIPVKRGPVNLPSTITVKKTMDLKRPASTNVTGVKKKQKSNQTVREVLTIDSDDEETAKAETTKPSGPQWYLRPEEQEDIKKQEEKNNTEPDTSKFIEITIEDSPIKPVKDKRTCVVGTELAIVIDDSPVKPKEISTSDKNKDTDNTPHSKKKLEYPEESIEIEIEPMEIVECGVPSRDVQEPEKDPFSNIGEIGSKEEHNVQNVNNENKDKHVDLENQSVIVEVPESPAKKKNDSPLSKPKEAPDKVIDLDLEDDSASSEFHPVYQQFIDLCLKIEDSVDMKTIVEKKIKSYYKQVPKGYTESEEFIDMVSGKILSMKAGPEKIYLYIKDIVDELNMQRKLAKQQTLQEIKKKSAEEDKFLYGEDTEFDSKRQRQIRKLEKTLKKLHRAIQKLEEQEVDFDDEEDSVYLLTERYKERMVRVHAKLCQLTNTKMPSEPRVQLDARPGQPSGPAKRLEKWVNKKVPIGTPLPFPDFHDVLRCVREANEDDKLGWNEADIMEEARDLFMRCGKKLQRRRQENEWRLAASRISVDVDPAEENEVLKKKLEENKQLATKKETEVFNKYADRQSMLKLEGEVVGDKEAEESPVESEEEEPVDDSCTMKNKERRKERLRRLLQEKPRNSDKTSSPQKEPSINEVSDEIHTGIIDNINDASNVENKKEAEKSETETNLQEEKKDENKIEGVHSISDSSDNVGSDVDELHLLQKLHLGNEVDSSNSESSDSLIDISDTIQSDNENNEKRQSDDVISIENSSYSDSEQSNDTKNEKIECDDAVILSVITQGNESKDDLVEKNTDVEQMLTVSDEDRNNKEDNESQESDIACMNTQDDAISIGDTEVQGIKNTTTTMCDVLESKSNSPELQASKITSSSEEHKNNEDDMVYQISESSTELNTPQNIDSVLANAEEVLKSKVDDDLDLNANSDKNGRNEDKTKTRVSHESNLSLQQNEMVSDQHADHSTEVTEIKPVDENVASKKSDKNEKNKDNESHVKNESNLNLKAEIMLNKTDSQNTGHINIEICSEAEKNLNNDDTIETRDSCSPEKDKLLNKGCPKNNTETSISKAADVDQEMLTLFNDETNLKTDSAESNIPFKDADISDDKKKSGDFKQTDSLEHMLEEFRSDLEAN